LDTKVAHHKRTRAAWQNMHTRIRHADKHFPSYLGRAVDPRWNEYTAFLSDMGECPDGHQLDRIDNSKGYGPDNCRWATRLQNARNRPDTRPLTNPRTGETLLATDWQERLGLGLGTLQHRIDDRGWSLDRALNTPSKRRKAHTSDLFDRLSPQHSSASAC
jgi:hypothetical protein